MLLQEKKGKKLNSDEFWVTNAFINAALFILFNSNLMGFF